jgi:hypothetical protein
MVLARIPKPLFLLAAAVAVYLLLSVLYAAGAHADGLPTTPAPGQGWSLEVILLGVIALFSATRTILQFVAPRTRTTLDDRALANIDELLALLRGGQAVTPRRPEGGFVRGGLLTCLIAATIIAVGGGLITSCAARQRTAAGVVAFLECEAPHVDAELLAEAKGVAIAAADQWISGSGHTDLAKLRAAARPLKSDLMRCALDGAIAALLTPTATLADAPQSEARAIDTGELAASWRTIRGELGWAPAKT